MLKCDGLLRTYKAACCMCGSEVRFYKICLSDAEFELRTICFYVLHCRTLCSTLFMFYIVVVESTSNNLVYTRGGEPIYYHLPHKWWIIASGPQKFNLI